MKLAPEVGSGGIFQKPSLFCSLTFSSNVQGGWGRGRKRRSHLGLWNMENPSFKGVSLDHHKNKQIKLIHLLIVWRVAVVKGLSVHVCQFGIEGSGREGLCTSFRKLPSQII